MGVPGFYRWAVRKVPRLRKSTRNASGDPQEFDNVYLDFNGVVHGCIEGDPGEEDEEAIFARVEEQILFLLTLVQPMVLLFIALDGVAPRAKMNQQRSRRFRSARDAELQAARDNVVDGGAETEAAAGTGFDRNAITPGTGFMQRLTARLYAWAEASVTSVPALNGVTVIISGDRDPGEGEHKIMEVIRHNPDLSHCLHSNDADLVFLGLVSPADNVDLLREQLQPPKDKDSKSQRVQVDNDQRKFDLLSITAVRDWLAGKYPGHDRVRLATDFAGICCLAGNDFLPHAESVDIYWGGLDKLLAAYGEVLTVHGHVVNEDLSLAPDAWRALLLRMTEAEVDALLWEIRGQERFADGGVQDPNQESEGRMHDVMRCVSRQEYPTASRLLRKEYYSRHAGPTTAESPPLPSEDLDVDSLVALERFRSRCFLQGVEWVLRYYLQGCSSWSWFYPAHYPPMCVGLAECVEDRAERPPRGRPFHPELQLLSVLPPQSAALLPEQLRPLLEDAASPVADLYPRQFEVDIKPGKREWQGVAMLPFIDEARLRTVLQESGWVKQTPVEPPRAFAAVLGDNTSRVATKTWTFQYTEKFAAALGRPVVQGFSAVPPPQHAQRVPPRQQLGGPLPSGEGYAHRQPGSGSPVRTTVAPAAQYHDPAGRYLPARGGGGPPRPAPTILTPSQWLGDGATSSTAATGSSTNTSVRRPGAAPPYSGGNLIPANASDPELGARMFAELLTMGTGARQ